MEPIENNNRNVTGSNWFTLVQLIEELKASSLTYVAKWEKQER